VASRDEFMRSLQGSLKPTSTRYSVAQIAGEVGYESEAAFNRAFKREFETPPARFRSQSSSSGAKVFPKSKIRAEFLGGWNTPALRL
jgi:AraC-like DNA-binding protein